MHVLPETWRNRRFSLPIVLTSRKHLWMSDLPCYQELRIVGCRKAGISALTEDLLPSRPSLVSDRNFLYVIAGTDHESTIWILCE
jgi:hypothetical protein